MARPLDNALLTLLARLRARRRSATSLVLLGWLLVAQTVLVVHRIDHNAADHNTLCAACVAADQSADVASAPVVATVPQAPTPVAAAVAESAGTPTFVSYRSRAPPKQSRA
jgi:hypothetical protein